MRRIVIALALLVGALGVTGCGGWGAVDPYVCCGPDGLPIC